MVHELGHIYVTFLSMGETNTPDGIGGYTSKGEAGSHLEILIFGGVVVALRNPAENDEQVCPYTRLLVGSEANELTLALVWRASPD